MLAQLTGNGHAREKLFDQFFSWDDRAVVIVAGVEYLITQAIFFQTEVHNLPQIAGIDITERIPAAHFGMFEVMWEQLRVFMRLDHIADPKGVDINTRPSLEGARGFLVHHFR